MSSIHNSFLRVASLAIIGLALMAGCQAINSVPGPAPLNQSPLVVDEAMQNRDWEPTAAAYQNDAVTSNPTDWTLEPSSAQQPESGLSEPVIYLMNLGLLPYAVVKDLPWEMKQYKGMNMPPTYTASPPLPNSPVPAVDLTTPAVANTSSGQGNITPSPSSDVPPNSPSNTVPPGK